MRPLMPNARGGLRRFGQQQPALFRAFCFEGSSFEASPFGPFGTRALKPELSVMALAIVSGSVFDES